MSARPLPIASLSLLACALGTACAVQRQMLAAPDELADYRAFASAAREGARLASAQRYLERHSQGAWADEVRAAFDAEEPAWFENAKVSRSRAREYVVDLPRGPHADAARALLVLFDEHQGDIDTLELLAASRRTAAMLDVEAARRKHVSDVVLEDLAALLDPPTWGARLDALPPPLASAMRGEAPRTWGGAPPARRDEHLFFVVPTPQGSQARVVDVRLQLWLEGGRIADGVIEGEDLFVRWAEAMQTRVLDPTSAADRRSAAAAIAEVLSGALEAALPASRCAAPVHEDAGEILARSCDGSSVVARMGARAGDDDAIDVRGKLFRAPAPGMR
jgi:hypothetical protein